MIKLLITVGGQTQDYTQFLLQSSVQIIEQINIPAQMTFSLTPTGYQFAVPPQRAYVTLTSTNTGRSLFTGFISAAPVCTYLAKAGIVTGGQLFQYDITATSDEYLLNVKAVPFIPAYVNQTQGDILTSLANTLCPGFFDCSMVASGDIVPYLEYDPTVSWAELAKKFGDGSRYRYKARDKQITYQPYGDQPLGIYYDEATQKQSQFSPKDLTTTVLAVPVVNDVTIIGDVEAGNNHEDYFLGDGFTANFPLLHKVFMGAETLLLQEAWTSNQLNTQQWYLQDPGVNFDFSAGALNVTDTLASPFALGQSYLLMQNGFELAGGIDTQVGECIFADYCQGVLGGIYADSTLGAGSLLAGFMISSPSGVVTSASGAAGVVKQPWCSGQPVGPPVVSRINHTYVLQMVIHAPKYTRYNTIYRTIEGEAYGGATGSMQANITFAIQDYDIQAATGFFYSPVVIQNSIENVVVPPFCDYALVNNQKLNVSITNTTVALMPLGGLNALVGPSGLFQPTGLILPMLPANSGGFIGAVEPWPSAASASILLPPGQLSTEQQVLVMGNGFELQAAQITAGNSADTLAFYAQSEPAAGTPVRFQSWEAQAAISRLQATGSIAQEAYVVGDDGIRSAIVNTLNPLPRTSEDCDNAALAYLQDRTGVFYNGSYTCTSLFFQNLLADQQYWPTVGRFLNVNAPRRGITQQKFLVTQLTVSLLDMKTELIQYQIQFGADLYLEKVLTNFVDLLPTNVLTPSDTVKPPNPRLTQNVDNTFLPDLSNVQVDLGSINGTLATVNVFDNWYGPIEIRTLDTNWGRGFTSDLVGVVFGPSFVLNRRQYDQLWYLRPVGVPTVIVNGIQEMAGLSTVTQTIDAWLYWFEQVTGIFVTTSQAGALEAWVGVGVNGSTSVTLQVFLNGIVAVGIYTDLTTSRRSKVLRIRWPMQPSSPLFVSQNGSVLQFNFNGDQRNIYGIELRALTASGTLVCFQKPVASYNDMMLDVSQSPLIANVDAYYADTWSFNCYFFNAGWQYSVPTSLLGLSTAGAFGGQLTLTVDGTLGIASNQSPIMSLSSSATPSAVRVFLKQAPLGASLILNLLQGGNLWMTLTVPAGATGVDATTAQLAAAGQLFGNTQITLDVVGAGGWSQSPAGLTVGIYY